ncbi:MAG TPA: hypothetical protein VH253_01390 [Phycisphaerae bacterium]|nr:hypothetical protein [Phycisphaerae bacterium]
MSPSKDRAYRAVEGSGDVLKRHIGKVAQEQYLPIAFGELSQGDLEGIDLLLSVEGVEGSRDLTSELVGHLHAVAVGVNDGRLGRMASEAAAVVTDQVHQDAKEPGLKLALIIISAKSLDNAQEGFLDEVLSELGVAGGAERVAEESLPVGVDEDIPGGFIAVLAPHEELGDGACVHSTLGKTTARVGYCHDRREGPQKGSIRPTTPRTEGELKAARITPVPRLSTGKAKKGEVACGRRISILPNSPEV